MKIAVWHNLPSGGAKRALYHHVKGLLALGHSVESWCPTSADQLYLPLSELITEHILPIPNVSGLNKNIFGTLADYYNFIVRDRKAMEKHCQKCAEEINNGGFDILFVNTCLKFKVSSIGRYIKIPKVIYLQEPARALYEAHPRWQWIAPASYTSILQIPLYLHSVLKNILKVHFLGIQAREEWLNIQVVDTKKFSNRNNKRENLLVGVGSFNRSKNIDFVIESLAVLKNHRPALIWIGNSRNENYFSQLKKKAESLNVDFKPKFRLSDDDLIDILNRATAMVYTPILEPFGLAPLEANACGLPVITIAEGGIRETIINNVNGLLVDYDKQAMANAVELIISDKAYARKLGENAHKLVIEKWSWSDAVKRLEKRFVDILNNKQSAIL